MCLYSLALILTKIHGKRVVLSSVIFITLEALRTQDTPIKYVYLVTISEENISKK